MLTQFSLRDRLNPWLFIMQSVVIRLFLGIVLTSPILARYSQIGGPVIVSPRPGDVLQGIVIISGSSDINGFLATEVSYKYENDPTDTWFQISANNQPIYNSTLTTWDTTVISDGNYILRLRVYITDGSYRESIVSGLRVQNYTSAETPTPTATVPEPTKVLTLIPTVSLFSTPTNLPRNPATLAPNDISASIVLGGLAALLIFIISGIYFRLRRK